jgi:hypothetical protein
MQVRRIQLYSLTELNARGLRVTRFQERIGEVFPYIGAPG